MSVSLGAPQRVIPSTPATGPFSMRTSVWRLSLTLMPSARTWTALSSRRLLERISFFRRELALSISLMCSQPSDAGGMVR